jgi:peptidoglycan/xylan/chitin deacetylase (PgdA/CDA1 family)
MNASFKKVITSTSGFFSPDTLIRLSGQSLIMPFYHIVSDFSSAHTKHLYPTISVSRFKKDLDFFQKNFDVVDAKYFKNNLLEPKKNKEKRFFLSFDDGLREFHDIVAPILLERNITATCFVNTDFVDNKDMFYRLKISILLDEILNKPNTKLENDLIAELMLSVDLRYEKAQDLLKITDKSKYIVDKIAAVLKVDFTEYLSVHQPYLTSEQIENLIKQGFSIGSHSMSHPYYPNLTEEEQVAETLNSFRFLQEKFKLDARLFSFPYTDFGIKKSFFERIKNEIDFSFGTANLKLDEVKTNFQRIPMEIVGSKNAASIIKTEYFLFLLKRLLSRNIIRRS